jgi:hypothetical protein
MKHLAWMSAGILTLAGLASPCAAQTTRPILPAPEESVQTPAASPFSSASRPHLGKPSIPCPPPPTIPGTATPDPSTPTPTPTPPPAAPDFSGAGEYKGSAGGTTSAIAGTGIAGAVTGDPTSTSVFTPLILPGLFTATVGQSALPVDRVFFEIGYFNRVAVQGVGSGTPSLVRKNVNTIVSTPNSDPEGPPTISFVPSVQTLGVAQSAAPVAGFNLNTFNIGVEKTFLDGIGSVYMSVPLLYATDNISGQQINGLGDINAGFKFILYQSLETGNTLTGGFTVSFPSGHAATSSSYVQSDNGSGSTLAPATSTSVNPTYLQPWAAGLLVFDRLYMHEYFGVVVPTDQRVATFLNSDFTVGYTLFRAGESRWFTSVTPTMSIQALIPVTNTGTPAGQGTTTTVPLNSNGTLPTPTAPATFGFTDQVFVSGGVQLGLGERWLLSGNVVVPVAGPRGYSVGATFGLNYFY